MRLAVRLKSVILKSVGFEPVSLVLESVSLESASLAATTPLLELLSDLAYLQEQGPNQRHRMIQALQHKT
jgi:hypothetical protein